MRLCIAVYALAAGLLTSLAASAQAATYPFNGPAYSAVFNFTAPCGAGACAGYTLGMNVSGWFATATPLAPHLVSADISGQVSGYSLANGLITIADSDPGARVGQFQVSTDASGRITDSAISVSRWQDNLAGPHVPGNRVDFVTADTFSSATSHNRLCAVVGAGDRCTSVTSDASSSVADYPVGLVWTQALSTTAVPTLSETALLLLAGLMAAGVGRRALRPVRAVR